MQELGEKMVSQPSRPQARGFVATAGGFHKRSSDFDWDAAARPKVFALHNFYPSGIVRISMILRAVSLVRAILFHEYASKLGH